MTATISFQNPTKLNSDFMLASVTKHMEMHAQHTADDVTDADVIAQNDNNDRFMNTFKMRFFFALSLSSKIGIFMLHLSHSFFNRFNYNLRAQPSV